MTNEAEVIGIVPYNAWTQNWELVAGTFDPQKHMLVESNGDEITATYGRLEDVPANEYDDEVPWYLIVEAPREFG